MTQMDADKSRYRSFICVHLRHLRILSFLFRNTFTADSSTRRDLG
jgi:hypothetical protein